MWPLRPGWGTRDVALHCVPFQRSAIVFRLSLRAPTATQFVGAVQLTLLSCSMAAVGSPAIGWFDQVVPFQLSTNTPIPYSAGPFDQPTALHDDVLAHETPFSSPSKPPGAFGVAAIDHAEPFQCSINADEVESDHVSPTIVQFVRARRTRRH